MRYTPTEVNVDERQEEKLKDAISRNKPISIRLFFVEPKTKTMLLTKGQIHKIERAQLLGKDRISIRLTIPQVKANTKHTGGFLWSLARMVGPAIVKGLASYATSKGLEKMFGKGLFVQKDKKCAKIDVVGNGLYLSPHPTFPHGEGVFEVDENGVNGEGLLLGANSPFKNVPLLNLLL